MYEQLIEYCYKPRTITDIQAHFKIGRSQVSKQLLKLQLENKIIRRVTDQGTERMAWWYMTQKPEAPAKLAKKYSKCVMGVWI